MAAAAHVDIVFLSVIPARLPSLSDSNVYSLCVCDSRHRAHLHALSGRMATNVLKAYCSILPDGQTVYALYGHLFGNRAVGSLLSGAVDFAHIMQCVPKTV